MKQRFPFARYALQDLLTYFVILDTLGTVLAVAAVLWQPWLGVPSGLCFVLLGFVVNFFRDPEREIPQNPHILVSPADGTVKDIEYLSRDDPRNALDVPAVRIGIFLSLFNVHVNRSPLTGRVSKVEYRRGAYLPAYDPRAIERNENNTLWLEASDRPFTVAVKQISGVAARRIVCPVQVGDALARGERFGMIKFGSRTELYVPQDLVAEVLVRIGAPVSGGSIALVQLKS